MRKNRRGRLLQLWGLVGMIILACLFQYDRAATPGLPFTEDFSDTDLRDDNSTNADWSTEEQTLLQAWREKRFGAFGASLIGSDITSDADSTWAVALGDVDGDGRAAAQHVR